MEFCPNCGTLLEIYKLFKKDGEKWTKYKDLDGEIEDKMLDIQDTNMDGILDFFDQLRENTIEVFPSGTEIKRKMQEVLGDKFPILIDLGDERILITEKDLKDFLISRDDGYHVILRCPKCGYIDPELLGYDLRYKRYSRNQPLKSVGFLPTELEKARERERRRLIESRDRW